jgi:hypothetical protein
VGFLWRQISPKSLSVVDEFFLGGGIEYGAKLSRSPLGVNTRSGGHVSSSPRLSLTAWLSFCLQPR